jgi:hypothetical protein
MLHRTPLVRKSSAYEVSQSTVVRRKIEFGSGARVCIRGEVAPKTLRQVIELLR